VGCKVPLAKGYIAKRGEEAQGDEVFGKEFCHRDTEVTEKKKDSKAAQRGHSVERQGKAQTDCHRGKERDTGRRK